MPTGPAVRALDFVDLEYPEKLPRLQLPVDRHTRFVEAAANVAGIAAFATLGFGFVMWEDDSDAEETLAEVREIRAAIIEGARKKSCPL